LQNCSYREGGDVLTQAQPGETKSRAASHTGKRIRRFGKAMGIPLASTGCDLITLKQQSIRNPGDVGAMVLTIPTLFEADASGVDILPRHRTRRATTYNSSEQHRGDNRRHRYWPGRAGRQECRMSKPWVELAFSLF
jgi:hypothetical protein